MYEPSTNMSVDETAADAANDYDEAEWAKYT